MVRNFNWLGIDKKHKLATITGLTGLIFEFLFVFYLIIDNML